MYSYFTELVLKERKSQCRFNSKSGVLNQPYFRSFYGYHKCLGKDYWTELNGHELEQSLSEVVILTMNIKYERLLSQLNVLSLAGKSDSAMLDDKHSKNNPKSNNVNREFGILFMVFVIKVACKLFSSGRYLHWQVSIRDNLRKIYCHRFVTIHMMCTNTSRTDFLPACLVTGIYTGWYRIGSRL